MESRIVGENNARQRGAALERIMTDVGHAVGDLHACQGGAVHERIPVDGRHAVADLHTGQRGTAVERSQTDTRHIIANHNTRNMFTDIRIAPLWIAKHRSLAADGKHTVSGQGPCKINSAGAGGDYLLCLCLTGQHDCQHETHENYADPQLCLLHNSAPLYT